MTRVLEVDPRQPDRESIAAAAEVLARGGLVAFPTETVYGLGAHALDAAAVQRIFAAKERPPTDPLIVHVATLDGARRVAAAFPPIAERLAARFWPGPLTIVVKRAAIVPTLVTAGLDTVAIRIPAHPVARALLETAALPVAAPSANLFSRPSPTQAAHVLQDLDGRVDLVLDGGPTTVGVESTVLDLSAAVPIILRPGAVTAEMLRDLLPNIRQRAAGDESTEEAQPSPGLLSRHYSPRAPLTLYEGEPAAVTARIEIDARRLEGDGQRVGILAADEDEVSGPDVVRMGRSADVAAIAARLYAALREIDARGVDVILARGIEGDTGLAVALQDRLRRAAAGRIVQC